MAQTKLQTYMPDTVKDDSDMILHKFLNENEVKLLEEKVSMMYQIRRRGLHQNTVPSQS